MRCVEIKTSQRDSRAVIGTGQAKGYICWKAHTVEHPLVSVEGERFKSVVQHRANSARIWVAPHRAVKYMVTMRVKTACTKRGRVHTSLVVWMSLLRRRYNEWGSSPQVPTKWTDN